MSDKFDVIVIGGGPAGYVCAVRLAQLGKNTAIIDKRETLGGTCLNVGCVPSKALLEASAKYEQAKTKLGDFGVIAKDVTFDLNAMMARKERIVGEVCGGVDFLMKKNKITRLTGEANFTSPKSVQVNENGANREISADSIVIATGSVPAQIPGMEFDGEVICSSDHVLSLKKVPQHLIIIGAGVIGVEMAALWRRLGAKVTIVEMLPNAITGADGQISKYMERILKTNDITLYLNSKVDKVEKTKDSVSVLVKKGDQEITLEGDVLLVAAGRKPNTAGLNLEAAKVQTDASGKIPVQDETYLCGENIYAIGDVIKGPMLAHKASEEGVAVAEIIAGQSGFVNYTAIPSVVYTEPELAWVGETEESLKNKNIEYSAGRFYFKANARAKAMEATDGFVKVLSDKNTDKILGVHIVGPKASELIAETVVAMEHSASAEDLGRTIHAHPTLSEAVKEAAMDAWDKPIHS